EQFLAGLLALAGVLGVGEGHLLHRKALRVKSADFAKSGSLFQSFLRAVNMNKVITPSDSRLRNYVTNSGSVLQCFFNC
ncbi:hypothetical protein, partial [Pseudomonas aeruginosa]|uniref:hypothetical protein n=1 Tax=Pseudomonas aeruginosa TaxID=287 RepID=UPI00195528A4